MQHSKNYILFRKEGAVHSGSEHKLPNKQDYSSYPDDLRVEEFEEFADTIDEQLKVGHPSSKEYKFSVIEEIGKNSSSYTQSLVETIKATNGPNFETSERLKR